MLSIRYGGANVPTFVGYNLGNAAKQVMRVFAVVLLVLVGVVFVAAPAALLAKLTPGWMNLTFWVCVIFAYYFLATIMPIDKIIGRFYPIFGAILIFMAVGITVMMFINGTEFYNSAQWVNQNPKGLPIFPLVFITIACGALSGFHATQSPLMARCMANEKLGKPVFYGSMVAEGFIGLVWATVGMSFYHGPDALAAALAAGGPGNVVTESSFALMGAVGGVLAILGDLRRHRLRHHLGRHGLPRRASDHRRNLQLLPEGRFPASAHCRAHVRHRRDSFAGGLQHHLALLRLGQPVPGDHRALGRGGLSDPQEALPLDLHPARHIHDSGLRFLYLL